MAPHEYVTAVRSFVEQMGFRIEHCWSAERRYPGCAVRSFEPRLEEWVTVVDRGGSSTTEQLRWKLARSLGVELVALGGYDHLVGRVERRCPGRASSS